MTAGRARAVVVATGAGTEIGHIAALAGAAEQPKTPLERRIAQFGRYIIIAAAAMFVVVNVIGLLRGMAFADIVMVAISQVVGMIPEGLPVAMTIALAVGVQRMARRQGGRAPPERGRNAGLQDSRLGAALRSDVSTLASASAPPWRGQCRPILELECSSSCWGPVGVGQRHLVLRRGRRGIYWGRIERSD